MKSSISLKPFLITKLAVLMSVIVSIALILVAALCTGLLKSKGTMDIASAESLETTQLNKAVTNIKNGALLVDVRTAEEFSAGHVNGALNIPHDQVGANLAQFGTDHSKAIVLYCRSGKRADMAKQTLNKARFNSVLNAGSYEELEKALR